MELQHLSSEVLNRINGYLGQPAVKRLRLVQSSSGAPAKLQPLSTPRVMRKIDGLPDGPLKDALMSLGGAVYK
jgi:hypothetical protein